MKIMCVDDDPLWIGLLREMIHEVLGEGATVQCVLGGREALSALEASGGRYDLVIVDLTLCDIDGLELVGRIHSRWPSLRLVTVSDGRHFGEVARARSAGAMRCLLKPFASSSFADICRALGLVSDGRSAASMVVPAAAA